MGSDQAEKWISVEIPPDTAYWGNHELRFTLHVNPNAVVEPIIKASGKEWYAEEIGDEYAAMMDRELGEIVAGTGVSVQTEPWGGAPTGGYSPDQYSAISLIGLAFDSMTNIVTVVGFAAIVRRLMVKAREMTGTDVAISNGDAVLLAADAIYRNTGDADLSLAFVTTMNAYLPTVDEMDPGSDGYLVGYRSEQQLHVVHVDWAGKVTFLGDDFDLAKLGQIGRTVSSRRPVRGRSALRCSALRPKS
jgi:hypothetical protein